MAWVNYRSVAGRFGHIDAEFVRSSGELSSDGGAAQLVVRFYAWWEHPKYVAAVERGETWGFSDYEAGKRDVTVRAIRPWTFRLSHTQQIDDWCFAETHPLLWEFAARSTIFANGPFDRSAFFDGLMALALPHVSEAALRNHIQLPDSRQAPLGLTMPAQLYEPVLAVLRQLGVPVFSPGSPATPNAAVVFLFGEGDYIIADDFEVDAPAFVHRPEWFQPVADQR